MNDAVVVPNTAFAWEMLNLPDNWVWRQLKQLAIVCNGRDYSSVEVAPESEEQTFPVIGSGGEFARASAYLYDRESVLFGRKGTIDKPLYHGGYFWTVDTMFYTRIGNACLPRFLHYFALTVPYEFFSTSTALPSMTQSDVGRLRVPLPSITTQHDIVVFLDTETARIDTLIDKQKKLIELLKEKRQTVISQAITKGLDPDVPMKDSGVEWLGEVPAHWLVGALGWFAQIDSGATPNRDDLSYWDGDIPWVKTGEIAYRDIQATSEAVTQAALVATSIRLAPEGTLLMAMYGQGVTRGRVAILGISAAYNQACAAIRPNRSISAHFLRFYFESAYSFVRDGGNETSQMNLSTGTIAKFPVTVPSVIEQNHIVSHLVERLSLFDEAQARCQKAITLLEERRIALITAAVTGQIDVTNYNPNTTSIQPAEVLHQGAQP